MRVKWLRTALTNLDEIADFIAQDNPKAAHQVVAHIYKQVEILADQPALGRLGRIHGTRELVIGGLPFIIPYRVRAGKVEILRVLHSARQWPKKF